VRSLLAFGLPRPLARLSSRGVATLVGGLIAACGAKSGLLAQTMVQGCQLVNGSLQCVPGITADPQQQIRDLRQEIGADQALEVAVEQQISGLPHGEQVGSVIRRLSQGTEETATSNEAVTGDEDGAPVEDVEEEAAEVEAEAAAETAMSIEAVTGDDAAHADLHRVYCLFFVCRWRGWRSSRICAGSHGLWHGPGRRRASSAVCCVVECSSVP